MENHNNNNNKTQTTEDKGYNWKSNGELLSDNKNNIQYTDAQANAILEKKNPNYSENPKDIIEEIEEKSKNGTLYESSNADYIVVITTTGIASLKDYLKGNGISGKYNLFKDGILKNKDGVLVYETKIGDRKGITITKHTEPGKNTKDD